MNETRQHFPFLKKRIYTNTAASGLMTQELFEWRQKQDKAMLLEAFKTVQEGVDILNKVRETVGSFFKCPAHQVAMVPNFTIAQNMLVACLPKGSRVLLIEEEYPSLNWPFEFMDFKLNYVPWSEHLETRLYETVKAEKIEVLAISMVNWVTGYKVNLSLLQQLKKDFPNLLIIADGTQYCGTEDFDFSISGIDILAASAYKWLLSGYGNGFVLFSEEVQNRISLPYGGNGSVEGDESLKQTIPLNKRLEPGHLDVLNFGSMGFSLRWLQQLGLENIGAHNKVLSKKAKNLFAELGLLDEFTLSRTCHSTIFNIKGNDDLYNKLSQENVICSQRGSGIRLSFHFYNTEEELAIIGDILQRE
ncbi:MAG: aminotransferase class V-fold PLP-dependent enzyme [Bacteroidota bacterium]